MWSPAIISHLTFSNKGWNGRLRSHDGRALKQWVILVTILLGIYLFLASGLSIVGYSHGAILIPT